MQNRQFCNGIFLWILVLMVVLLLKDGAEGWRGHIEYENNPNLVVLTPNNFNLKVKDCDDDIPWFVQFYADWCPYCKKLAPEWIKTAEDLKGKVNMGIVNVPIYPELRFRYRIKGFPTILMFGADKENPEQYYGPRTAPMMIDRFSTFVESEKTKKK